MMRLDIAKTSMKSRSDIELERSEREGADRELRQHCVLVHHAVDEKLGRLESSQADIQKTVICIDKKIVVLLRQNGVDESELET